MLVSIEIPYLALLLKLNRNTAHNLLKLIALLWLIWGAVHIFAGGITMYQVSIGDISAAVGGIADAVDPASLQRDYPAASGAIISQHGFNLLWIGLITFIAAFLIWQRNRTALWLAALVGGLADLGYFLFLDLGGYVHFLPGTLMTLISGSAILLSLYVNSNRGRSKIFD